MIDIIKYDDKKYRTQVIELWKAVFGYKEARNDPGTSIDKKLAVHDDLFYLAGESNRIIGTIMAGYDGHRGWIYSLAVLPEKRKQQVGTILLKYIEEKLKNLGCLKINLQILKSNVAVKEFYEKNGYKVEERISMGKVLEEHSSANYLMEEKGNHRLQ
ncbi:MAG: GNAT family acetyltransferase [Spirochaetales bacterium]|nr:GNAT family acetyltransferase [Spirochaetales bacterium]